mmetsp:Transcript_1959/g.5197  ORF Transcript_1959/g.5197 Transcript_1959/m.5197 type:complete len:999 (-) Transcript_1959:966-3962(-)
MSETPEPGTVVAAADASTASVPAPVEAIAIAEATPPAAPVPVPVNVPVPVPVPAVQAEAAAPTEAAVPSGIPAEAAAIGGQLQESSAPVVSTSEHPSDPQQQQQQPPVMAGESEADPLAATNPNASVEATVNAVIQDVQQQQQQQVQVQVQVIQQQVQLPQQVQVQQHEAAPVPVPETAAAITNTMEMQAVASPPAQSQPVVPGNVVVPVAPVIDPVPETLGTSNSMEAIPGVPAPAEPVVDPAAGTTPMLEAATTGAVPNPSEPAAELPSPPVELQQQMQPAAAPPPPSRRRSSTSGKKKSAIPPDAPVIYQHDVAEMDVLSGRGAAVNNHPGNKKFRALCFVRKAHFDLGNHAAKRRLATEIVELLQSGRDHPPSRFLKRRPPSAAVPVPAPDANKTGDGAEAASASASAAEHTQTLADQTVAAPEGAATATGAAPTGSSAPQPVTYYAMTKEQAILKAQQVMRDYKRPDRLEWKLLQQQLQQQQQQQQGTLQSAPDAAAASSSSVPPLLKPPRSRAVPSTPLEGVVEFLGAPNPETDDLFRVNPFGVHAHDVLSGRGAYVNGHVGNARLRSLALERKARFDTGNYTEKRLLAAEIVAHIRALNPPGRFLKHASAEVKAAYQAQQQQEQQQQQQEQAEAAAESAQGQAAAADPASETPGPAAAPSDSAAAASTPAASGDASATADVSTKHEDPAVAAVAVAAASAAAATENPPSETGTQPQEQPTHEHGRPRVDALFKAAEQQAQQVVPVSGPSSQAQATANTNTNPNGTATAPPAADLSAQGAIRLIDGVWEELSDDKAIHKACQVMRDISRPDRKYREERREQRLQRKHHKRRKLLDGSVDANPANTDPGVTPVEQQEQQQHHHHHHEGTIAATSDPAKANGDEGAAAISVSNGTSHADASVVVKTAEEENSNPHASEAPEQSPKVEGQASLKAENDELGKAAAVQVVDNALLPTTAAATVAATAAATAESATAAAAATMPTEEPPPATSSIEV